MGFMNKVKDMLGQHGDKVGQGLDKAAEAVDSKTGGKYSKHIQTGTQKAKEAIASQSGEGKGKGKGTSSGDSSDPQSRAAKPEDRRGEGEEGPKSR